jgi:cobalt-zinc-cadmium efflux system outer membrane protein
MKAFLMPMLAAAFLAPVAFGQTTLGLAPPPAVQQTIGTLTLAAAVDRAQQHNGELRALREEVAALEARASQAGARPNPTLEYLREGNREQGGATAVQLAIPFELGGKRGARVDAAMAELQVATADLAAAQLRVQAEVVAAFHEAYLAGKRLELATQASGSARQSSHSAAARVLAGKISPVEETRAKVAEANLQVEAIQARRDLAEARVKLALLWGGDPAGLSLAVPAIALPRAPDQAAMAAIMAGSPGMQRANADLNWRSAAARLERSKRYPDVSLIVGQKREGVARERQTIVGLSVPLPLFDRNQGAIREAERRIDKSRAELAWQQQRLHAEASQAAIRLNAALEQERVIREDVLPGGQSAFAAARTGFEAGKFNFLEVLDAQRTYFHAQAQHLRAISEAHRAAADLATLIGPTDPSISTSHQQDAK